MSRDKLFNLIFTGVAIAALAIGGYAIYAMSEAKYGPVNMLPTYSTEPVACAQDAMLCPDGSYVSRVAPKCEFAPCHTPMYPVDPTPPFSGWRTYENTEYGFTFKYPAGFDGRGTLDESQGSWSHQSGTIGFAILDKKLDPKHIESIYGPIKEPESLSIGTQIGYGFRLADAGCGGFFVHTALGGKTLQISFGSCEGHVDPISVNKELIAQILSTFTFTK